jgi:hypothetical protein
MCFSPAHIVDRSDFDYILDGLLEFAWTPIGVCALVECQMLDVAISRLAARVEIMRMASMGTRGRRLDFLFAQLINVKAGLEVTI